ncbi:protein-disulfide reductase DsbD [Derxia gummosa]|uniref:Thiol:disulfide interchange protein DsbD n=1 Tax=Derxia gummosa DSM 723 TaxID=1121388 RepID=A0A9U5C6G9_9BURK|nr:protein-disulfide reductase DsbD [Derxia gummosa]
MDQVLLLAAVMVAVISAGRTAVLRGMAIGVALLVLTAGAQAADDFLDPTDAFRMDARLVSGGGGLAVEARFTVADGYYVYHDRFAFSAEGATLGEAEVPPGKVKFDENFGKEVETHRGEIVVRVPVAQAGGAFDFTAKLQGCADKGLCYPPETRVAHLDPARVASEGSAEAPADRIAGALASRSVAAVVPVFLLLGLLLSFTPCVLPMLPILASIIVGQTHHAGGEGSPRKPNRGRGFTLALAYSLGMALVYTAIGVAAGLAGEGLAATLQKPWVLALFAALLAGMALSMFGFYELQLPANWQSRLASASGRQHGGRYRGVFVMGALSALIVGPCVAAPLAGALLYISQTRDVLIGGLALFSLAAGMSVPLLLLGLSAGTLLPRAGAWMEAVKRFFGLLLLATAVWMLAPVLPDWAAMLAWATLAFIGAALLGVFETQPAGSGAAARLGKGIGYLLFALGAVQVVGVASGGRDVLRPLAVPASARAATGAVAAQTATAEPTTSQGAESAGHWQPIDSLASLDTALGQARGRLVMLDFYADWCVSCKEMERFTFADPAIAGRLAGMLLLRADVTANADAHRALLRRFGLFGPPGIVFFGPDGRELDRQRVIGFEDAATFGRSLDRAEAAARMSRVASVPGSGALN